MRVREIMTETVIAVRPEASLKEAARLLAEKGISGLPVVADGTLLGVLSDGDVLFKERGPLGLSGVLRLLDQYGIDGELKLEARTVADAMTLPAVTIEPDRSVSAAAALMLEQRVHRLPVVEDGALVGIVTRGDLVRAFARGDDAVRGEIEREVLRRWLCIEPGVVTVEVDGGDVTLEGEVERHSEAAIAEALVTRVAGVVSVDSRLRWREDDGGMR
jgi:CBS domain-containing protein